MPRSRTALSLLLLLCLAVPAAAQPLTQEDWMRALVNGLGWSFGLPDEPTIDDYATILAGQRLLRVEAEAEIDPGDMVSVKTHHVHGEPSGGAWVSGIASPTVLHLRFLLPLSGEYLVRARLRLAGHRLEIGGSELVLDGGERFALAEAGPLELDAGPQELVLHLPANGGIDYLELEGLPLPAVAPRGGWHPEAPLRRDDLALTALRLLDLVDLLPADGAPLEFQAEAAPLPEGAELTPVSHLGPPRGGAWVRAGHQGALVGLPLEVPREGAYRVRLRALGDQPLALTLGRYWRAALTFPGYLDERNLASLYLPAGPLELTARLPSRAGLDAVMLQPLASTPTDVLRLAGLTGGDGPATPEEVDRLMELLAVLAAPR